MEQAQRAGQRPVDTVIDSLVGLFGNRVSTSLAYRQQHANTVSWVENVPADAVVNVRTTEEVAQIVSLCAQHHVPVIPFGTGTSIEGHINAPYGGITISLREMDGLIEVNAEDMDCRVQPGMTRKTLNEHLRATGLFFPIDPGADASLGGMASTRASGTNAVRYGTMKQNVLGLTVVLPDGTIARTGGRARKSSAGYDLTSLMVGAEGTLGIITELTLRLHPIAEAISGGICPFPSVSAACNAVIATIQSGIPVARIELLDTLQIKASNAYSKLSLAETPTLCLEFHGSQAGVAEQSAAFNAIASEFGGGPFTYANDPQERSRFWTARHDAHWAAQALIPGARVVSTDVCVPISRLADCVTQTQQDIAAFGLIAPILGHVGDGNFHVLVLVDDAGGADRKHIEHFLERLVERAIRMGGTCTGEHGVGNCKMKYLPQEHGEGAMSAMAMIKKALDPLNIMNPGKIVKV